MRDSLTPEAFGLEVAELVETAQETPTTTAEFKTDLKRAVRAARMRGLAESQIRTQLAAKAGVMQRTLDG